MCGICGFTGRKFDQEKIVTNMMNRIIHRGPDGSGKFINEDISMGFRRLSIIDLDTGDQPMFNEAKNLVITFNGEIYNYRELRKELIDKGHVFSNNADTEVLLHGYEEWGEGLLDRLRGMFAFVIWDIDKKELFGARDMFGIKPFYYAMIDNEFVYGSEIKSILEYPGYHREVSLAALEQYLSFEYSVLPETFFEGVFKLLPGHFFRWKDGNMEIHQYFDPMLKPAENKVDHDALIERLDEVLQESIRYHMVSDVEVGSLLSGGVDSSYVACHFHGAKTFSVGFEADGYNEIDYAKELSETIGIKNYSKVISADEYWGELSKIQYYMDEPLGDAASSALYFVDREASKYVKAILSGEGSDEFFAGYPIYHEPFSLEGYMRLPKGLRKALAKVVSKIPGHPKGKGFLIRGSKDIEERFIGNLYNFEIDMRNRVLKYPGRTTVPSGVTAPYYKKVQGLKDTEKMQYIDLCLWLPGDILLKADKMSMAHSIESRVPFLDREVFEVAKTIPLYEKVTDENTKECFREVAHKYLSDIQAKRKKLGFPVPIRLWLRQDKYYDIVKKEFTSPAAEKFFHTDELVKIMDEHKSGREDYSRHIWIVYMFLLWYREFFEEGGCSVSIEDELALDRSCG